MFLLKVLEEMIKLNLCVDAINFELLFNLFYFHVVIYYQERKELQLLLQ
jgi:hypothetical protein